MYHRIAGPQYEVCRRFARSNANSKAYLLLFLCIIETRDREMVYVGSSSVQTLTHMHIFVHCYVLLDCQTVVWGVQDICPFKRQLKTVSPSFVVYNQFTDRAIGSVRSSPDLTLTQIRIYSWCCILPVYMNTILSLLDICPFQRHLRGVSPSLLVYYRYTWPWDGLLGLRL